MSAFDFRHVTLTQFLEEIGCRNLVWYAKRLSGNDTGLTGAHQAGPYVPKDFASVALPEIATTNDFNPTIDIPCIVASHGVVKSVKAKYYNSKFFPDRGLKKKYDEFRLTRWTGTPLADAESTGSLFVLAKNPVGGELIAWVANNADEEDLIESWIGSEVEPGQTRMGRGGRTRLEVNRSVETRIPPQWKQSFPSPDDVFRFVTETIPASSVTSMVDDLLLKRRRLEFEAFQCAERCEVEKLLAKGFSSADQFLQTAVSLVNRRKSRSGASLEKHLDRIFRDEHVAFEAQVTTEQSKRPDFIFPSAKAYHTPSFDSHKLHMLASKTCCKDRWRQVIHEAERIETKHLFTLQEGISSNQLSEMETYRVVVVTPRPNIRTFPKEWQNKILDLATFVELVKTT